MARRIKPYVPVKFPPPPPRYVPNPPIRAPRYVPGGNAAPTAASSITAVQGSAILTGIATTQEGCDYDNGVASIGTAFSMSVWVRIDTKQDQASVLGRGLTNNSGADPFVFDNNASGQATTQSNAGSPANYTSPFAVGVWTFCALTWDGGTVGVNGTLKTYAGVSATGLVQVNSHTDTLTDDGFNGRGVFFGRNRVFNGSGYHSIIGRMAAGKVWSGRVLTLAELKTELPYYNMQSKTSAWANLPMKTNFVDNSGQSHDFVNRNTVLFSTDGPSINDDP